MESKKILKLFIIASIIILASVLCPKQVNADGLDFRSGSTGDTQVSVEEAPRLKNAALDYTYNRKVSDFSNNGTYYYLNNKSVVGNKQIMRSRAVFCVQNQQSITDEQNDCPDRKGDNNWIWYQVDRTFDVNASTGIVNRNNNETIGYDPDMIQMAYILSFKRNSGNDYESHEAAQNSYVQKALWKFLKERKDYLNGWIKPFVGEGENVTLSDNGKALYDASNAYRNYVASGPNNRLDTDANIENFTGSWANSGTNINVGLNLSYVEETSYNFANVKEIRFYVSSTNSYNANNLVRTITSGFTNNYKTYTIPGNNIASTGGYVFVEIDYYYTNVISRIVALSHTHAKSSNAENCKPQLLLIASGERTVCTDTQNENNSFYIPPKSQPNISLQKYIVKVNGEDINATNTNLITRINATTTTNDVKANKPASKSEESNYNASTYKRQNPVYINAGDTVTYRIIVYNNSTSPKDSFYVEDRLPWMNVNGQYVCAVSINARDIVFDNNTNNGTNNRPRITLDSNPVNSGYASGTYEPEKKFIKFKIENLAANSGASFTVTLKFNNNANGELLNSAWVSGGNNNEIQYRTTDRDYVQICTNSVSLEKFVSKVNTTQLVDEDGKYTREGKRYNEDVNASLADKNSYKGSYKVGVETGDTIEFTIRLKNTGVGPVKITQFYDTFGYMGMSDNDPARTDSGGNKNVGLEFVSINNGWELINQSFNNPLGRFNRYLFQYSGGLMLAGGESKDITLVFKVNIPVEYTNTSEVLFNKAAIYAIETIGGRTISGSPVNDGDGSSNNADIDYLQAKDYAVSLEKYVSNVDSEGEDTSYAVRAGKAEHKYDNDATTTDNSKYNDVVTVQNGDIVTYDIIAFNDNPDTNVKFTQIGDYLPKGVELQGVYLTNGTAMTKISENDNLKVDWDSDKFGTVLPEDPSYIYKENKIYIYPGINSSAVTGKNSVTYQVKVKVTEPNLSLNILTNKADIAWIKNGNNCDIKDTTWNNNSDQDYIKLNPGGPDVDEAIISGKVWNDKALDKTHAHYNGLYDDGSEDKLSGIPVYLYRNGITKPISTKTTNDNGEYSFADNDIDSTVVTNAWERYIKGPTNSDNNRWAGTYYSYYVTFEYNGITYTSTAYSAVASTADSENSSNAREKLSSTEAFDGKVNKDRTSFNDEFSTINNESEIDYTTKHESGYIPQSIHEYNPDNMKMQSSTNLITLSNDATLEDQLKHIDLGLRGRDIFDLELTSDVAQIDVTINNQVGVYKYTNKTTLRRNDLSNNYTYAEDMANTYSQGSEYVGENQEQHIRESDYNVDTSKYDENQSVQNIQVTYRIVVENKSDTAGTASKVTSYYDDKYKFEKAFAADGTTLSSVSGTSGTGYKSEVITTPGTRLNSGEKMEIYVVYTLNVPIKTTLAGIAVGAPIPTYNMAEITEYKTFATTYENGSNNEATRGLLDKDSRPGSANEEQVRLTTTVGEDTKTIDGDLTTVEYYFNKKLSENKNTEEYLLKLKYEDDTYATPTLYFVIADSSYDRKITGTVFRDETTTDATTKIKTGNGKLDSDEVGVYKATVELIELVDEEKVRFTTTTDENGKFEFTDFLPGNYIIRYHYGDTENTVLLNKGGTDINKYSFNGEDYQATNNIGTYGAGNLNDTTNFWYVYNEGEGISTARDNLARRKEVRDNVVDITDNNSNKLMNMLIRARSGAALNAEEVNTVIEKTKMFADTAPMKFTVEKTELVEKADGTKGHKQRETFGEYKIENMNFGIAEVPLTKIDLSKEVNGFTLKDATGQNVIASIQKDANGNVTTEGDVIVIGARYDVSVEDDKLQGARFQITYRLQSEIDVERNYDNTAAEVSPTITGLVDFINNNLSYNGALGLGDKTNDEYWEVINKTALQDMFDSDAATTLGTIDPNGTKYTTIVKAKEGNPLLSKDGGTVTITLEKILTSTDATIEEIVTSTVDASEYSNIIEITGFNYTNTNILDTTTNPNQIVPMPDRIITGGDPSVGVNAPEAVSAATPEQDPPNGYVIRPGQQHDYAISDTLTIHPPTGTTETNIMYYVIALVSLVVLTAGIFGIKKFVIKK